MLMKVFTTKHTHFNVFAYVTQLILISFLCLITACSSVTYQQPTLDQIASNYFKVYAKRSDFDQLMAFYDDEATLKDIVYGNYLYDKKAIHSFLDWDRGIFRVLSGDNILTVTKQTLEGRTVITQGYFHAFEYDGKQLGPWLFNITLEFNAMGKIIEQTDWINYTPRENFLGGINMNEILIKNLQENK